MDEHAAKRSLGDAIRRRRVELGYSQDTFADHIQMHRAYYSSLERGERNVTLRLLLRLAKGLRTTLAALCERARL